MEEVSRRSARATVENNTSIHHSSGRWEMPMRRVLLLFRESESNLPFGVWICSFLPVRCCNQDDGWQAHSERSRNSLIASRKSQGAPVSKSQCTKPGFQENRAHKRYAERLAGWHVIEVTHFALHCCFANFLLKNS